MYQIPTGNEEWMVPRCKNEATRNQCMQVISVLCWNQLDNLNYTIQFGMKLQEGGIWRTKRSKDWSIAPIFNEKSLTGYVGIKNLGCICYMNSLMQ